MSRSRRGSTIGTAALLAAALATPAAGQVIWDVNGDGVWASDGNWDIGSEPTATSDTVIRNPVSASSAVNVILGPGLTRATNTLTIEDTGVATKHLLDVDNNTFLIVNSDVANDGVISLNSGANATRFRIGGDLTISGSGELVLNGVNAVLDDAGGVQNILTQAAGHTIRGQGTFSNNNIGFVNQAGGMLSADVAAQLLNVNPGVTHGFTNQGTFQAVNGGLLRITGANGGNLDSTGGLLLADGAASEVQYTTNIVVTGGTLRSTNGGLHRVNGGQNGFFNGVVIDTGTVFNVGNNADAEFSNSLTNRGTINLNPEGNGSRLGLNTDMTLDGGGTIALNAPTSGNGDAEVRDLLGVQNIITNVDNTFRGQGLFGGNSLGFVNQSNGVVSADINGGTLTVDPGVTHGFTNQGTFQAVNGGILLNTGANGGGIDNTGGLFLADGAGSEVQYTTNVVFTGGTLRGTNDGVHRVNGGQNAFFDGVVIDTGTTLNIDNNADGEFSNSLTNRGTINLNPDGNQSRLGLNTDMTLDGGGTIVLNAPTSGTNVAAVIDLAGSQSLITNVDNTFRGAGNLGSNNLGFINQANGVVSADINGGTLEVNPGITQGFTNQGTFQAVNGGILLNTGASGGDLDNSGGLLLADGAGSEVQYTGGFDVMSGTLRATNGGLHRVNGGQTVGFEAVTVDTDTSLVVDNNTFVLLETSLNNRGTVTLNPIGNDNRLRISNGDLSLTGGGTIELTKTGSGNSIIDDAGGPQNRMTLVDQTIRGQGIIGGNNLAVTNGSGGVILAEGGTLTIDPGISPADEGISFINEGELRATNGSTLTLSGAFGGGFENADGGKLQAFDGSTFNLTGELIHRQGASIAIHEMNIGGGGNFVNEADDYSPGTSVGTVNNSGIFTNAAYGDILFEINSATDFDQIVGTGAFNLAGGIDIDLGFTPNFYESIELILDTSGRNVVGEFDEVLFDPIVGVGEALAITYRLNQFNQADAVLLTRAIPGDANLNGQVEQGDLNAVLNNWGSFDSSWSTGDLNGNGQVEQGDLNLVLNNWGDQFNAPDFSGFAVPEPTAAIGLLGLASLRRRSRRATLTACH
ncbi:MAG: hypothetical protein AAF663_05235 [Planctomycetota bacterium]